MPERLTVPATAITPDYRAILDREAAALGVPVDLARRIVGAESSWNPKAVSPKGAIGLMQLMPGTAAEMGGDPHDPIQNIQMGLRYFKRQLDTHKGDPNLALAAYNAGPGAVARAGGVPPFKETQDYIQKINPSQASTAAPSAPPTRITVPATALQRVTVSASALQPTPEAEGRRMLPPLPGLPAVGSGPRTPPPAPQTFERTGPQMAVEGLRRYSVLPTAGAIAGAPVGALAGGPTIIGVPLSGVAGAGAGAALGESAQVGLERAVGLSSGPPAPRIAREGAFGMAGEGIGGAIFQGAKALAGPFVKKMTLKGYEALRELKGQVLPAQVTESRILDILQNIAEGSMMGGGRMRDFKLGQDKVVEALVDNALTKYGGRTAPEAAGSAYATALEGAVDSFHAAGSRLYRVVDNLTQGAMVPTSGLQAFTAEELAKRSAIPREVTGDSGLRLLKEFDDLAQDVVTTTPASSILDASGNPVRAATTTSAPKEITFEQANFLRGQLLQKIRMYSREGDDVARGIAEQLVKRLDGAMEQSANNLSPQAQQAWRQANTFWREGKAQFETKFLRGLIEKHPDKAAQSLMQSNNPVLVREARNAVSVRQWQPVQAAMATQLVEKATNPETGAISGRIMLNQIKTLGRSVEEIFPTTVNEVKRLARILSTVQQGPGEATGKMYIQLAQGSALAGVVTGGVLGSAALAGSSGVILLTPIAIARIMTSPTGMRWLTTGLTAPRGSQEAIRATTQLATFLAAGEADRNAPPRPSRVFR